MPITKASFSGGGIELRQTSNDAIEEMNSVGSPHPDDAEARDGKTVTISGKKGQKPIKFQKGGLHQSLGVPPDEPIPASKMAAAKAGRYGNKAKKQANFAGALAKMRPKSGSRALAVPLAPAQPAILSAGATKRSLQSSVPSTTPAQKTMPQVQDQVSSGPYPGYQEGPKPRTSARSAEGRALPPALAANKFQKGGKSAKGGS